MDAFKNSLMELMERMNACYPHFIRCLKPNPQQRPSYWETSLVERQLKYAGVLETIKIRKVCAFDIDLS